MSGPPSPGRPALPPRPPPARLRRRLARLAAALPDVDAEELYDELVAAAYRPLPSPVPLVQLIPVLIDVWEADGLLG